MSQDAKREYTIYEIADITQHQAVFFSNDSKRRDYGTGEEFTPVEVFTVGYIADNPGCTAAEIADNWSKTPSAVSQIIKRLRTMKVIESKRDENDSKRQCLYVTEKGKALDQAHRDYEDAKWQPCIEEMLKTFTMDEIYTTYAVLEKWYQFKGKDYQNS